MLLSRVAALALCALLPWAVRAETAPSRVLLWGDTHLHTSYSFDAFLNGNLTGDPDVAYRFARGLPVIHPYNRTRVQLQTPLDFLVVTDHAEFYGGLRDIYNDGVQDPDPNVFLKLIYWYQTRQIRNAIDSGDGPGFFREQLPTQSDPFEAAERWVSDTASQVIPGAEVSARNAWQRMLAMADAHNEPGRFTTLIGWEWSTIPGGANLHRVVVTDAKPDIASRFLPFSSTDSPFPEDLWTWMEATAQATGANFVAIPHNSNISKGVMFNRMTLRNEPMNAAYAAHRARFEPVVEITQIKGDSETHPALSPDDPFADFETYPFYIQQDRGAPYEALPGDYVRSALRTGLALDAELGANPFRFGVIGSTDSHTALASAEEPNFWGKMAYDSVPERKQGNALNIGPTGWSMQAGGLAAVWAEENSREAILAAFQRREVYATSGPRIVLKVTAENGSDPVNMGGTLVASAAAPTLTVSAAKDPMSANLDRVQIVKGWLDADNNTHEAVFDVAWSGNRQPGVDGTLPPVGDTVDRATGGYTNTIGAASLEATWTDPAYDPTQRSFYYVRVLEIPTPRHSLLDALALGMQAPTEGPQVIQERAYSSAVWVTP